MPAALKDVIYEMLLFRVQFPWNLFYQKIRKADDRVQRCPQLMAHIGKELAFCLVYISKALVLNAQILSDLPLCQVTHHCQHVAVLLKSYVVHIHLHSKRGTILSFMPSFYYHMTLLFNLPEVSFP